MGWELARNRAEFEAHDLPGAVSEGLGETSPGEGEARTQ